MNLRIFEEIIQDSIRYTKYLKRLAYSTNDLGAQANTSYLPRLQLREISSMLHKHYKHLISQRKLSWCSWQHVSSPSNDGLVVNVVC